MRPVTAPGLVLYRKGLAESTVAAADVVVGSVDCLPAQALSPMVLSYAFAGVVYQWRGRDVA